MNNVVDLKGRLPYDKTPDKSARPKNEMPKQPRNFPKMPKAVWEELAPQLLAAGLLTNVDGPAFALLCSNEADLVLLQEKLNDIESWIDTTPNGYKVQSCWFNMRKSMRDEMWRAYKEFGMTPASRSTLKTSIVESKQGVLFDDLPSQPANPYDNYGPRASH